MNLIFRCSELHRLMGNAKSIDSAFLTEEVQEIKAKKKRNDDEQKILDDLLNKTLSATAKTLVKEKVRQLKHKAPSKFSGSKETRKGNLVEEDAILFLMQQKFISAEKNTIRFTNDWITGEPDIITDKAIRDTKCPWSYWTMEYFKEDVESKALDAGYDWQQLGYMWLLRENHQYEPRFINEAWLDYILMPTPKECLSSYDDFYLHHEFVLEMDPKDRISSYKVEYDQERIDLIKLKVEAARKYANTLVFGG
ncbi:MULTISPECIES: hypothetical protein [Enterobacteriaceae]|uniref:hypothetical protein n=1 Tax=Enterobacteriaceae TaxID=543 RepID=UPI002E2E2FBE|nr:hypothetical protein [Klebsiella pneumoniae]MED6004891.1 hypothetical protein [Klebsiella pneumoniae]MED6058295.1 hypothetical protein [Klebsiella pneumoniae]